MTVNSSLAVARDLATTPAASTPPATSSATSTDATIGGLANQDTFLKLLIAQMQNQDPLSPSDPVQMVSQLAQFSNLEQTMAMKSRLDDIYTAIGDLKPAPAPIATATPTPTTIPAA